MRVPLGIVMLGLIAAALALGGARIVWHSYRGAVRDFLRTPAGALTRDPAVAAVPHLQSVTFGPGLAGMLAAWYVPRAMGPRLYPRPARGALALAAGGAFGDERRHALCHLRAARVLEHREVVAGHDDEFDPFGGIAAPAGERVEPPAGGFVRAAKEPDAAAVGLRLVAVGARAQVLQQPLVVVLRCHRRLQRFCARAGAREALEERRGAAHRDETVEEVAQALLAARELAPLEARHLPAH